MWKWLSLAMIALMILSLGEYVGIGNTGVNTGKRASVNENLVITSQQDFENGTLENLDSTSNPGDLLLQSYTSHYNMGQLDTPDSDYYWTGGYTDLPGDSDFKVPEDGTITSITINVGDYNGPFKIKVLRSAGTNTFYAVATSQEFSPGANQENTYSVNLPVKAGDRLGIYTDGSLSALSFNGNTGMWWTDGEVQSDPVTMNWDSSDTLIVTMQATVQTQKYLHYGNWTSNTLQLKAIPTDATLSWNADTPSGTEIVMHIRTSPDGYTWSAWSTINNGESIGDPQMYMQLWAEFYGEDYETPVLHDITINYNYNVNGILINEISSYGSGNDEWVEIYNSGGDVDISGLSIDDQDGNSYTVPSNIGTMPHGTYLVIYFGSGTDDEDFSDGTAHLYANFNTNILNDNGDDVVLSIGNSPMDYVGFWSSSGGIGDVDPPPAGLNFVKNGDGYYGYAPAPGYGESISLIPNAQDRDEACDWYITPQSSTTPGGENANLLKVDGSDVAPASAKQYDTVPVIKINFECMGMSGEFITVNKIDLHMGGTAVDSDIAGVYLYYDDDQSGNYSSGDSLQAQTTFTSNNATFTTSLGMECGSSYTYFVVVKIAKNADTSHYANFNLGNVSLNGRDIIRENGITTKNIDIQPIDSIPPYVTDVALSPHSPVGVGNLMITIYFSEDMNTSSPLNVTYGPTGYEHTVSGNWIAPQEWSGNTYIYSSTENGNVKLEIKDGKDLVGNVMNPNPYEYYFVIDTQKPHVTSISFNTEPPLGIGNHQVIINFNENMNTSINPTVKFGIHQINYVTGSWDSSTRWIGTLVINQYNENGNNTLTISDAEDLAGNTMLPNTTIFYVDTESPGITGIEFSKTPPLKSGAYSMRVYFSEKMNTSKNPTVTFGINHTYYVSGSWMNSTTWVGSFEIGESNDNGENVLTVKDAEDKSGNTMNEYHYSFVVDTKKPKILSVDYGRKPIFKAGSYSVKITFNEDMNTSSSLNVSYGINSMNYVSGNWVSDREWDGRIIIENDSENGRNTLYILDGMDLAGNLMDTNSSNSFTVDTVKPTVTLKFNPQPPYGNNSQFTVDMSFSEDVSNVQVEMGSITLNAVKISSSEYMMNISTSFLTEGNHTLVVEGAVDAAGNVMDSYTSPNFVVDKTPPTISLDYKKYVVEGNSVKIVAEVEDSLTSIKSVVLRYTLPSGETREVEMDGGNGIYIAYIENVQTGKIRIEVIAKDVVGNSARKQGYINVQSYLSTVWWLYLLLIAIILAIIILFMKRQKERKKKGLPGIGERFRRKKSEDEFYEE